MHVVAVEHRLDQEEDEKEKRVWLFAIYRSFEIYSTFLDYTVFRCKENIVESSSMTLKRIDI